jgi:hypothetical protein
MPTTFVPKVSFLGFPSGKHREPVKFKKGQESIPVPEEFVQFMREKGLVADPRDFERPPPVVARTRPKRALKAPAAAVARRLAAAVVPKKRRSGKTTKRQP